MKGDKWESCFVTHILGKNLVRRDLYLENSLICFNAFIEKGFYCISLIVFKEFK